MGNSTGQGRRAGHRVVRGHTKGTGADKGSGSVQWRQALQPQRSPDDSPDLCTQCATQLQVLHKLQKCLDHMQHSVSDLSSRLGLHRGFVEAFLRTHIAEDLDFEHLLKWSTDEIRPLQVSSSPYEYSLLHRPPA